MPPSNSSGGDCHTHEGAASDDGAQFSEWMDPSMIKFSQEQVSSVFARRPLQAWKADDASRRTVGSYAEALKALPFVSLDQTLLQLKNGSLTVKDIPVIRVCKHEGKWYTLDNRRLWVFRQYGQRIPVLVVEPSKEFFQKLTNESDGEKVLVVDLRDKETEVKENEPFVSIVLRWSVEDVMNERMYINRVAKIPTRFSSVKAYFKAFFWPFLEDTRGQVKHSLEAIGSAPYMSLRSVEELESSSTKKTQLKTLKLTTHSGRNFVERNAKDAPWKPKPTDLVVLCTLVPESLEDLRRSGEHYSLAKIFSADDSEEIIDDSPLSFKITAFLPTGSPEYIEIVGSKRTWYAVYLNNLATGTRIWEALNPRPISSNDFMLLSDSKSLDYEWPLVKETLYSEFSQGCTISEGEHQVEDGLDALVEKYCNFRQLNESQTEAVRSTVMGLLKEEGFRVRLIQGPPGTGKTSTTSVLLAIVSCLKDRVLVCAPTNRAVSEISQRFLQSLKESLSTTSQFSDFVTLESIGITFCRPLQFGDVVMVGNEDKLDTDGILGKIFLSHRKKRLLEALAPLSGWRHTAQLVVNFLEDALNDFKLYVKLWKENEEHETPLLDFLQFVRKQLKLMGLNMMKNGKILCNDLSSKRLSPDSRKAIRDSRLALGRLLDSLTSESLTDAEVRQCFTSASRPPHADNGKSLPPQNNLYCAKQEFLELMSSRPGYSIKGFFGVPTALGIEEICLKDACLVFSTASSAGRQCIRKSGPFQYAVIDEAAQLVEAETAIVTQVPGVKQALLVGDPQQLQALVTSQIAKDCGYGISLFERLQTLGHPCHVLNLQYRMHPAISQFPNRQFYNGAVHDGENVLSDNHKKPYQALYGPYAFIDVRDGVEERDENDTSWKNPVEAEVVHHLITKLRAVATENVDVGVIAPYKSQVDLVTKRQGSSSVVTPSGAPKQTVSVQVGVKTVDGFQGGEKDVILFSAVRANGGGHIGFVEDARRLNVALTRGRYCVLIIGNASTLAAHDEMWRALVVDAKRRHCYFDARDDQGLKKTILRVKKELEQIASLLHHDSILFNDTTWKVLFSKEFKDSITKIKCMHKRQTLVNTIVNLANGRRSPYPTKCSSAAEPYARLMHVQPTSGLSLVWTIDVQRTHPVMQIIKIWDAVESSHSVGLIRRLEASFSTYTQPYIDRCSTVKFQSKTGKVVVPAVWKHDASFRWHEAPKVLRKRTDSVLQEDDPKYGETRLEKSTVEESILLMKFYALTSGIARQLLTEVDGSKMELVFEVNEEEAAIIEHPFSTFILGRSGTGKTTVITTRLLKNERKFGVKSKLDGEVCMGTGEVATLLASEVISKPMDTDYLRQAMITLSPKLCAAIKHHIAKASRTMLAEDCNTARDKDEKDEEVMLDEEEEFKLMGGIPDTLVNIDPNVFPLVITFRKFLTMIDGSVSCPFMVQDNSPLHNSLIDEVDRCEGSECSSPDAEEATNERETLGEEEDEEEIGEDLYSQTDEDEDCENSSLDEDQVTEEEDAIAECSRGKQTVNPGNMNKKMTEVTFERFIFHYWPRFNQDLIKHFDPSVVFTEIISFIKGSLEALHTENGRLTRKQYLSLSVKRTSNFDEQQREAIYSIFVLYERYKSGRKEYDIADYCMHLYAQMRLGNYKGLKFHYVYVDEVQDLTMAQIALFKYVCHNMEQGYVFAGDTAQTIARGVSFRFQDMRHLFYTEFLERGEESVGKRHRMGKPVLTCDLDKHSERYQQPSSLDKASCGKSNLEKTPHMPDLHHLSHNFRTHVGIVNIANSIVQLLHHFFPNSVDKLDPESSLILGETPIFLEREENHEFVTSLFGHGGAAGGGGCDFGAEQVILVRDMETKHDMMEKLGKRGLVMSVLECKGLEFQDVLLYNFFTDSLLENKWRVIYSYIAENLGDQDERHMSFPKFNVQKHNLLMSELKQLYVVVTRARQRLWIYDECPEYHKPMLDFWNRSGLIQLKRLDKELIKTIHGKSTPEDWKRRGVQMFNDHHYDMAQLSFERAGDMYRSNWAKAAGLQQAGERVLVSDMKAAVQLFREAATLFLSLEKGEAAAKCYLKTGEHRKAGMIFRDSCKPPRLEEAGKCFMDAKSWREAADAYGRSFCVRSCLAACFQGKLLDLGVDFIAEWEQQLKSRDPDLIEDMTEFATSLRTMSEPLDGSEVETCKVDYLKKCALYYHKQKNADLMMKFVRRFPTISSQKVFLKRRDYFDLLMEVEEGEGNFIKAAEMAEAKGDLKHAANLLVQGGCHEQAVEKILERARFDMLWSDQKLGWPLISTTESEGLLKIADKIVKSCSPGIRSDLVQELDFLLVPGCGLERWKEVGDSNNIRLNLMAGRRAIDEILSQYTALPSSDDQIFSSAVVRQLLSVWDWWSKTLILLIKAINRAQRRRDTVEDETFLECSNTYLGAVKHTQPHLFLVTDAATSWLKNSPVVHLPNQGRRCQVTSGQLFSLAEAFWAKQLWRAGLGIIKMLDGILFTRNEPPVQNWYATGFSAVRFQPSGEQLHRLYSITETVADIVSPNAIQEGYLDLRTRLQRYGRCIYEASFPFSFNKDVLTFRHEVGTVYDSIATCFMQEILESLTPEPALDAKLKMFETEGRIQILLPLLSMQCIKKIGPEIESKNHQSVQQTTQRKMPQNIDWPNLWVKSCRMYGRMTEDNGQSPRNTCGQWLTTAEEYCGSLKQVYFGLRKSISPFMFAQMLERAIVVKLACHTHLHNLFLPESLVVNHMSGENNRELYSSILNMGCTKDCQQFFTGRFISTLILDMLNSSYFQVETWFNEAKIDWRIYLPSFISRLVICVLTVCINASDRQIWDITMRGLRTVLHNGSPLLTGLPSQFMIELRKIFSPQKDDQVRGTFMRAMAALKDPLYVLKHRGRKIATWAHVSKIRVMVITHVRDNRRMFGTNLSTNSKPMWAIKLTDGKIQKADFLGRKLEDPNVYQDTTEDVALQTVGVLLRSSPPDAPSDYFDAQEELPVEDDANSPDAWIGDESTDDPYLAPRAVPPGHVSIGEGQTVPLSIKSRLLQHLQETRQRLKEELSATERYCRDTRTAFRMLKISSKEYLEVFLSKACPLKATADEWLQKLETSVQALKDEAYGDSEHPETLLDDMADSQDSLQKAVVILDPRNKEHKAEDLNFLEEKLAEVKHLLEIGNQLFLGPIRKLEKACKGSKTHDGNMSNEADGECETCPNQAKAGNNGKNQKPPKKKKKKKARK